MANDWKRTVGQANSSSPSSIQNAEHYDRAQAKRVMDGTPGTPSEIVADSTTEQPVPQISILRVTNTNAAVQFLFVGKESDVPGGAPDITEGYALPPNSVTHVFIGKREDGESDFIKSSSSDVQVIVCEA